MSIFNQAIDLEGGHKVIVTIEKSKCGRGIVVCQERVSPDGKKGSVSCSGSCGGGPTINWSCPDGKNCQLDCTSGSPVGSCY
jgi:hypothetical protein